MGELSKFAVSNATHGHHGGQLTFARLRAGLVVALRVLRVVEIDDSARTAVFQMSENSCLIAVATSATDCQ